MTTEQTPAQRMAEVLARYDAERNAGTMDHERGFDLAEQLADEAGDLLDRCRKLEAVAEAVRLLLYRNRVAAQDECNVVRSLEAAGYGD